MQDSRTPRLVEHFWVPILGASCSNKLFVGTVRPSHERRAYAGSVSTSSWDLVDFILVPMRYDMVLELIAHLQL